MNNWQAMVGRFHRKLNQPINSSGKPSVEIERAGLRSSLIHEEALELCEAIQAGDLTQTVDGMCDLIYVVCGTALEFGIDLEPFFYEVHMTNMAKVGGPVRGDGKILKPEGWQPPRIEKMLNAGVGAIK